MWPCISSAQARPLWLAASSGATTSHHLSLFAIIFCGGYGIMKMIGFTTNRLTVAESKAASNSADCKSYGA